MNQRLYKQDILWPNDLMDRTSYGSEILQTGHIMVQRLYRQDILWPNDVIDRTSYGPQI